MVMTMAAVFNSKGKIGEHTGAGTDKLTDVVRYLSSTLNQAAVARARLIRYSGGRDGDGGTTIDSLLSVPTQDEATAISLAIKAYSESTDGTFALDADTAKAIKKNKMFIAEIQADSEACASDQACTWVVFRQVVDGVANRGYKVSDKSKAINAITRMGKGIFLEDARAREAVAALIRSTAENYNETKDKTDTSRQLEKYEMFANSETQGGNSLTNWILDAEYTHSSKAKELKDFRYPDSEASWTRYGSNAQYLQQAVATAAYMESLAIKALPTIVWRMWGNRGRRVSHPP